METSPLKDPDAPETAPVKDPVVPEILPSTSPTTAPVRLPMKLVEVVTPVTTHHQVILENHPLVLIVETLKSDIKDHQSEVHQ